MKSHAVVSAAIHKVDGDHTAGTMDLLAVEEPLEIRVSYEENSKRLVKNVSVTMRTPGNDAELAAGFLFTEGILKNFEDIDSIRSVSADGNSILVELNKRVTLDLKKLERHFYTSSSCGVCGKSSIESVKTVSDNLMPDTGLRLDRKMIYQLPELLRQQQDIFESTGGLHASALFDGPGNLLLLREDVGRHNALDKLIGAALEKKLMPLSENILLLSGRASFELIQKASMAGIQVVAAVGAPSSLAVELAKEFDMTLIGFLRRERFNIYCGGKRMVHGAGDAGEIQDNKTSSVQTAG